QPVTHEIEHSKGILRIRVGIQVESGWVFPLHETKSRVGIHSPDARLRFCNYALHRVIPGIDTHRAPSSLWRCAVTACTKACARRTACCASRWLTDVTR